MYSLMNLRWGAAFHSISGRKESGDVLIKGVKINFSLYEDIGI